MVSSLDIRRLPARTARFLASFDRAKWDWLRLILLVLVGRLVYPKYRFRWPQLDWVEDQDFGAYLARFDKKSWGLNADRRWIMRELLRLVESVPGDTAECGVYEGAGSWLMCRMNAGNDRQHHMFDSFEGLSQPAVVDGSHWRKGAMARHEDLVRANLAPLKGWTSHRGWIPTRFSDVSDRRFAFVHIDVDLYEPTRDCMAFFYERMSDGGIILCDDYGQSTCPGATRAVDEFLAGKPEAMIMLPSGGGFLIKGSRTGRRNRMLSA
jgi:hypothetical protein